MKLTEYKNIANELSELSREIQRVGRLNIGVIEGGTDLSDEQAEMRRLEREAADLAEQYINEGRTMRAKLQRSRIIMAIRHCDGDCHESHWLIQMEMAR